MVVDVVVNEGEGVDSGGGPFSVGNAEEVREERGDRRWVAHPRQAAQVVDTQLAEPAGYVRRGDSSAAQLVSEVCTDSVAVVHGDRQD